MKPTDNDVQQPAASPNLEAGQSVEPLSFDDLQAMLVSLGNAPGSIQSRIAEKLTLPSTTVESVLEFTELFSPDNFDDILSKIREVLLELGVPDNERLSELAEYLFADIFIGRPHIDPAYI